MNIEYVIKPFNELTVTELYNFLKLRCEVFVVEQMCAYQEMDGKDMQSYHLMCYIDGNLAGYTRLLPAGVSYDEVSIGRVIIAPAYRGLKLGRELMEKSIASCEKLFKNADIRIGAQAHLTKFYNSLGFVEASDPYDDAGILHIDMIRMQPIAGPKYFSV